MKLYGYFRSSAAYRVRIALNLKELGCEQAFVHLRKREQLAPDYRALNPQGLVPTLVDGDVTVGQSLAILEYLDETRPQPRLLPADPPGRARVRQLALIVACDIHPLNNLKVLNYLSKELAVPETARDAWYGHWVADGLAAFEALLRDSAETGRFCHGDAPTIADCCLVPQLYNARRFKVDLAPYPTVLRVEEACQALDAFARAAPGVQPDAE